MTTRFNKTPQFDKGAFSVSFLLKMVLASAFLFSSAVSCSPSGITGNSSGNLSRNLSRNSFSAQDPPVNRNRNGNEMIVRINSSEEILSPRRGYEERAREFIEGTINEAQKEIIRRYEGIIKEDMEGVTKDMEDLFTSTNTTSTTTSSTTSNANKERKLDQLVTGNSYLLEQTVKQLERISQETENFVKNLKQEWGNEENGNSKETSMEFIDIVKKVGCMYLEKYNDVINQFMDENYEFIKKAYLEENREIRKVNHLKKKFAKRFGEFESQMEERKKEYEGIIERFIGLIKEISRKKGGNYEEDFKCAGHVKIPDYLKKCAEIDRNGRDLTLFSFLNEMMN